MRRLILTISTVGLGKALKQLVVWEEKGMQWKTLTFKMEFNNLFKEHRWCVSIC